jgi:hypothetical protein
MEIALPWVAEKSRGWLMVPRCAPGTVAPSLIAYLKTSVPKKLAFGS